MEEDKKTENAKKIENNNKDIEDDEELKEELNEWEVESTHEGD